jgi:hypothetical protein
VSFINPHDIAFAPGWLQGTCPPGGLPVQPVYFQPPLFPPSSGAPALYSTPPSPWNYEDLTKVKSKPACQYNVQSSLNKTLGPVTDWTTFLNQYYWLQSYVDQCVGSILDTLASSPYSGNTVVVFTSDHGEYGGSHGLHDKGGAAYDEAIRVPLYVSFPGQRGSIAMNQMCSSVDIFGLVCDLATRGGGRWQFGPQAYPDLSSRQSIWNFLYANAPESRLAPGLGIPYIFHTSDDVSVPSPKVPKSHIVCLRTKADPSNPLQPGAKLGVYSAWAPCTTIPDGTPPDYEFYDYNPATTNNRREMGNDFFSSNPVTQASVSQHLNTLGTWSPSSGLIASELNPPLTGTGTDGMPLAQAQTTARQNYFNAVFGAGFCLG